MMRLHFAVLGVTVLVSTVVVSTVFISTVFISTVVSGGRMNGLRRPTLGSSLQDQKTVTTQKQENDKGDKP